MAVRDIRIYGDPVLRAQCAPIEAIDDSVRALVTDLCDTVALPGRAGVAAPQIGVALAAFSYNVDGRIGYVLNPGVVETSGERREIEEGCLSVPDLWFPTPRFEHATVRGIDLDGRPVTLVGDGLMAQALQHETDHLQGMVYLRRLSPEVRKQAMRTLRQQPWF